MSHPPLRSARLLDQLRERIRYAHYSLRTEKTYVYWAGFFIRFHNVKHPKEMGAREVEAFLSYLANDRKVSPSTHRQALAAILYLYKEVLDIQLPWMEQIDRPKQRIRVPIVLSRGEVAVLLAAIDNSHQLVCQLLYGAGLRLMECLTLRVKDLDFDRRIIVVRQGKGGKDRLVMLPSSLTQALRQQLSQSRCLWAEDRSNGVPGVFMPDALARKYPRAAESWAWHWVFPSPTISTDPRTKIRRLCSAFILPEAAPSEGYQSGLVRVPPIPSRAHERILVVPPAEYCFGMHEAKIGESMPRLRQRHR